MRVASVDEDPHPAIDTIAGHIGGRMRFTKEPHTMRLIPPLCLIGLLTGLTLGMSCTNVLASHCANLAGDQTCTDRGMGSFCSVCSEVADGCSDVMPSEECYFAGSEHDSDSSSPITTTTEEGVTADEASGTAEPKPSCTGDADCMAPTPFCGADGECVACDDISAPDDACASLGMGLPVCVNGVCGECDPLAEPSVCSGKTPVCDDDGNICVACTEHAQCGGAACNFYTGACLPKDAVVHVGQALDFMNLTDAVASFPEGSEGTIIVHQQAEIYNDAITVDGGRVLAFLASESNQPLWDNGVGNPTRHLTIDGGTVLMDGLVLFQYLNPSMSGAIMVTGKGSRAWIDRSRIVDNIGGIRVDNGAEVTLRNCFLNGQDGTTALEVANAHATILYSTVATTAFVLAPALRCTSPADVEIRNSIIVSQGGFPSTELECEGASVAVINSATEANVGEFNSGWFDDFNSGDLHLTEIGAMVFADIAQWQAGDPPIDIDGDSRIDGTPDHPGADRR